MGAGSSIPVFGTGAVGTAVVMAGHAAGAATIIGVDVVPSPLLLADLHPRVGRIIVAIPLLLVRYGHGIVFGVDDEDGQ